MWCFLHLHIHLQVKSSDAPRLKHEKELKPASMRVRDAAEALLSCVLSQVSFFEISLLFKLHEICLLVCLPITIYVWCTLFFVLLFHHVKHLKNGKIGIKKNLCQINFTIFRWYFNESYYCGTKKKYIILKMCLLLNMNTL